MFALAFACGGARPTAPTPSTSSTPPQDRSASAVRAETEPQPIPEQVRVRVLFIAFEGRTEQAAEERTRMLARAARSDDFSALASTYGDGENAGNMGAAGLMLRPNDPRVPARVAHAAFVLHLRQVSEPIRSDEGYWVLQRVE